MTKILLVEDDKSLREIYGVRLLAEGYDIVSAGDGEEALAMAIKEKPTLIISDVMMPKISGFDMLDILRSTTETRDIKVIMMTALSSDDQRTRGEQLGADRYLVKSQVGIEDVVRTVHEVLADTSGAATAAPAAPAPADTATPVADPIASVTPPVTVEPVAVASEPIATTQPLTNDSVAPVTAPVPESNTIAEEPVIPESEPVTTSYEENGPGPLPPQPNEDITALPQPTAPFSTPRPTNLGERVIHPLDEAETSSAATTSSEVGDQIAKELEASPEPVISTQVDEAVSDADVEPAPTIPSVPQITTDLPTIEPVDFSETLTPQATPETPISSPVAQTPPPAADIKPPVITGTSTPIS